MTMIRQSTKQKTKERATQTSLKTRVNSGAWKGKQLQLN
jgi:hypothetical protein